MDYDDEANDAFERDHTDVKQEFEGAYKETAVILIDVQAAMHQACGAQLPGDHEPSDSWFKVALKEVRLMLKLFITQATADRQAIIFYGSRVSKNTRELDNIYVYSPLEEPSAKLLRSLAELPGDTFQRDIGAMPEDSDKAPPLSNALLAAGLILSGHKGKARRVVRVFTQQADPSCGLQTNRDAINAKADNLREAGTSLEPYLFVVPGQEDGFDQSFWRNLRHDLRPVKAEPGVSADGSAATDGAEEEDDSLAMEVTTRFADLQLEVRHKGYKRRRLARTTWHLAPKMELAVCTYALTHTATRPANKWLDALSGEPLKSVSSQICQDTGEILKEIRLWQFPKQSQDKKNPRIPPIEFSVQDRINLTLMKTQGLRLLGFKPMTELLDYHQLRSSTFLYPDEATRPGSTQAFIALHEALRQGDRFALCSYVRNARSGVALVAVLPAIEAINEDTGVQEQPPGMHMIHLPFADDIRRPERDFGFVGPTQIFADEPDIAAATAMIEALSQADYQVGTVPNPALQRHFEVLEHLALEETPPPLSEFQDLTLPDTQGMSQVAGEAIRHFKDTVYGLGVSDAPVAPKRKAAATSISLEDIESMALDGTLHKCTAAQMDDYLGKHSLKKTGVKAVKTERIVEHVRKKAKG